MSNQAPNLDSLPWAGERPIDTPIHYRLQGFIAGICFCAFFALLAVAAIFSSVSS
jgi:hypothetical protein